MPSPKNFIPKIHKRDVSIASGKETPRCRDSNRTNATVNTPTGQLYKLSDNWDEVTCKTCFKKRN